jgi:DNA-nicking Smr family endonuclease
VAQCGPHGTADAQAGLWRGKDACTLQQSLPAFRLGEKAEDSPPSHNLAPNIAKTLAAGPLRMDAKVFAKMSRGKIAPDARIDLHGLTLAEAQPELIRFIFNAQSAGFRLVLVITGKGKRGEDYGPIPQRQGALRHQVPHWLRQPPLGQAILQVTQASLRHGGEGAYYVYLRRFR